MKYLIGLAAVTLLSSCSIYGTYKTPDVSSAQTTGDYYELPDSAETIPVWSEVFTDPELQKLITQGLAYNTDLKIAELNIEQAQTLLLTSKLAYLPSFMLSPEGSISSFDKSKASYAYSLPVNAQWEIDLFGKLRNNKEKSRSILLQSQEYKRLVETQLISTIANSYYTLQMLRQQLEITRLFINNQKQNLEIIIAMKEAGLQTEAGVNQATANYLSTCTSEKDLLMQIQTLENNMALLLNQAPEEIITTSFDQTLSLNSNLFRGISLEALSNRPDVKNAEYKLRESFYDKNAAHSAFYPSITLGGTAGWTNNLGGMIANPGKLLLSAVGSLTQPLFNRGLNMANLKVAKIQYDQALLSFHQSLLNAGVEVNNALIKCQNSTDKVALRNREIEANEKALSNSLELMKHSSVTYLEVIYAENSLLQSRLLQVSDWFEGIQGQISLYKSLGGGSN